MITFFPRPVEGHSRQFGVAEGPESGIIGEGDWIEGDSVGKLIRMGGKCHLAGGRYTMRVFARGEMREKG